MKRKKIVIVSLIIIVLFLLGLFLLKTEDRILIARTIVIPKGVFAKNIAKNLEEEGIIKNQTLFLILAKISGASSRFKAGEYELNNRMRMTEIIERLKRGKTIIHRLIIPEGYTLKDIANLLEKNGFANKYKFLNL
ncbi:MAG: endolytic transglycosylase MltG, partial [bacterium]